MTPFRLSERLRAMLKNFIKDNFGGPAELAAILTRRVGKPVTDRAIYQWQHVGEIPKTHRFHVAELAVEKQIRSVPSELLDYVAKLSRAAKQPSKRNAPPEQA